MAKRLAHPLSILGIDELEERTYETLLDCSEATLAELTRALGLPSRKVQSALKSLEAMGLVTCSLEQPRRYLPMPPNIALEALILQRQEALQRAREEAVALQKRVRPDQDDVQQQIVELITSPEAERRAFEQMQQSARHEMLFLVRHPLRISSLKAPEPDAFYKEAQARGVKYRRIADTAFLNTPMVIGSVRDVLGKGWSADRIRVLSDLPFKMVMADRHSALIPLKLEDAEGPVLLLRSSALLDALYALFEFYWERAAPVSMREDGQMEALESAGSLGDDARALVQLLAAGLNDKTIAHELAVSKSTLDRRMQALREHLAARTRFQAGWLAALRLSDPGK